MDAKTDKEAHLTGPPECKGEQDARPDPERKSPLAPHARGEEIIVEETKPIGLPARRRPWRSRAPTFKGIPTTIDGAASASASLRRGRSGKSLETETESRATRAVLAFFGEGLPAPRDSEPTTETTETTRETGDRRRVAVAGACRGRDPWEMEGRDQRRSSSVQSGRQGVTEDAGLMRMGESYSAVRVLPVDREY